MANKPKQKPNDSSWNEENDRMTNPNRRQEEDRENGLDTPYRSGQKASKSDVGSEPRESDRLDESQRDRQQTDTSRRQRHSEE